MKAPCFDRVLCEDRRRGSLVAVAFSASDRATIALSDIYPAPNWMRLAARGQDVRGRVDRDVHARWNRYARPSSAASALVCRRERRVRKHAEAQHNGR
jgi:hypothetical protein